MTSRVTPLDAIGRGMCAGAAEEDYEDQVERPFAAAFDAFGRSTS